LQQVSTKSSNSSLLGVLNGHKFANLTTLRKNGQEVTTPVWFATVGDTIYVVTTQSSGKVKRLRNNPAARLGPSDQRGKPLGQQAAAVGRLLSEGEQAPALAALNAKYGLMKRVIDLILKLRGLQSQRVYLAFKAADGSQ
jgi:PPOX class probable F420-dependent enzyme